MKRFFAGFIPSCLLLCLAFFTPITQGATTPASVILVHGAFADGSSWSKVIPLLQAKGIKVVAVQNPLTSLADDVAVVKRAIANQPGRVTLVGHSWGGMVITEAGNDPKVVSLVYIAALVPSVGQSAADILKTYPTSPGLSSVQIDAQGFQSLTPEAFENNFAQDVPKEEAQVLAAIQGPVAGKAFQDKASVAAWQTKKSWYIVAEQDRMIQPDLERDLAKKINATILSLPTSHVPIISRPEDVANAIILATQADDGTSTEAK